MVENNAERFLKLYNEIDYFLRQKLQREQSVPHKWLLDEYSHRNRLFAEHLQTLKEFAELRNAIIHNPFQSADPIAEPHDEIVEMYEKIRDQIFHPKKALDCGLGRAEIVCAVMTDKVSKIIKTMSAKGYSLIPVLDERDQLVGIFSESAILNFLSEAGQMDLSSDEFTMADFTDFLPLSRQGNKAYEFLDPAATVYDAIELYEDYLKKHQKLAGIFITTTGLPNGKVLGLLTAWDVAGYKQN